MILKPFAVYSPDGKHFYEGDAPKVINDRCSHGKTWAEECPACKLVSAHEIVNHWGKMVDEARKTIAEARQTTEDQR